MTAAKPQSMAAQTEAPDDLIAELARLMADEARDEQPGAPKPAAPVRIPGADQSGAASRPTTAVTDESGSEPAAVSSIRIPGGETTPFAFNFDLDMPPRKAGPATPVAASHEPVAEPDTQSEPAASEAPLDQDSLTDLIAAELAADMSQDAVEPVQAEIQRAAEPPVRDVQPREDNFGSPPIFGLGSVPADTAAVEPPGEALEEDPAPSQAPTARHGNAADPLDEIERLVGPAVLKSVPEPSAPAPSPALRSLATPVVPVQPTAAPVIDTRHEPAPAIGLNSVDEAILAAAAATGAHVEWVNDHGRTADTPQPETDMLARPERRRFQMNRAVAGPLVAVGLLAVAGFGLYWALGQGGTTAGPAPLIAADTTPVKEVPEADATSAPPQSVVFNEISGNEPGAEEQLVSRDQADTAAVVAANTEANAGVMADTGESVVDPNQDGLVNRKVRTVTVRPDGTIVSGEDSLAGSAILPVDRPNVPDVPGADFSTPELIASAQAEAEAAAAAAIEPAEATAIPEMPLAEPGATIAVVDAGGAPLAGRTVTMPMQRPSDFAALASAAIASANTAPQPAAAQPAQTPQPVSVAPAGGSASAYVQLASQRSEDAARQSAQAIATRYGVLFGGASLEIQRVDLGERGIYYRVLVPAASRESASNICANVKAAGGDCLLL